MLGGNFGQRLAAQVAQPGAHQSALETLEPLSPQPPPAAPGASPVSGEVGGEEAAGDYQEHEDQHDRHPEAQSFVGRFRALIGQQSALRVVKQCRDEQRDDCKNEQASEQSRALAFEGLARSKKRKSLFICGRQRLARAEEWQSKLCSSGIKIFTLNSC